MNKLMCVALMLLLSCATNAQKLILQPQIGVRNFKFQGGENYPWSPKFQTSASAGARLMYLSKKGHGPYVGFHANSLIVNYMSTSGHMMSRNYTLATYEAGYQWMSKPAYFKRIWDNGMSREEFEKLPRKGWAVQFMPSAGLSYMRPLARPTFSSSSLSHNGSIGLTGGMTLAFSKNDKQIFNFSVSYTGGLYDLYNSNRDFTAHPYLSTKGSGFNIGIGVPLTLFQKKK